MIGNEGTGLNQKQKDASDAFIIIPQTGDGKFQLLYCHSSQLLRDIDP
jgi:hypothetical protein